MKKQFGFSMIAIGLIVLSVLLVVGVGFYGFKTIKTKIQNSTLTKKTETLFGTMLAFNINDAMGDPSAGVPGIIGTLQQKGWTEFRKDNSAYQNLFSNLEKLIQDRTKLVKATGFSIDRGFNYFIWNVIEPQKGQFDWALTDMYVKGASNAGVKISAVVQPFAGWDQKNTPALAGCNALDFAYYDYKVGPPNDLTEYKNFLTKIVERYKDNVAVWEIGNEVEGNCGGYKNNPQGYVALLKTSYETIKKSDPKAKVLNGGALEIIGKMDSDNVRSFWQQFFALGGGQYIDYFNLHYNIERTPDAKSNLAIFQENLTFFNNLMDKSAQGGGGRKPLYLTEFGIYSGAPSTQPPGQPVQGQLPSGQNLGPQGTLNQNQGGQQQMDSPKFDNTYFTISSDGKNWQPGSLVVKEASVPDVIQLQKNVGNFKKGDLLIYFVDFSNFNQPGTEALGLIVSRDSGKTWGNKTVINLVNKPNKGAAVDPSIVQLNDGRLRLYFFGSEITAGDPALATGPHKVYSAISSDGINFIVEGGVRFQDHKLTDPEVIQYENQWFMYYSVPAGTKLAVSSDGLNFSVRTITGGDIGVVPGAVVFDGGVRIFACGNTATAPDGVNFNKEQRINTATAPDGINFTKEQGDIFSGKIQGTVCDPAVIKLADGKYSMVYKIRQPQLSTPQGGPQTENQQPVEQQPGTLPAQSQESQAALYFKYSILAFANGANFVFIDLVGPDNDVIGSSMAFNAEGQPRLFLTTLKTIESKIGGFSKVDKIADSQYKFTVGNKTVYALWSETLPNEISGKVKVTDIKGQEQIMDATGIKLRANQPVFIEL